MRALLKDLADQLQHEVDTAVIDWTDYQDAIRENIRLDMIALTASSLRRAAASPDLHAGLAFVFSSLQGRTSAAHAQLHRAVDMSIVGMMEGIQDSLAALERAFAEEGLAEQAEQITPWSLLRIKPLGEA